MLTSTIFELWLLASPLLALLVATLALYIWAGQLRRRIAAQKAAAEAHIRGVEDRIQLVEDELRTLRSTSQTLLVRQEKPNSGSKKRSETAGLSGDSRALARNSGRTRLSRAELDLLVKLNQMKRHPDAGVPHVAPKSSSQAASLETD